MKDKAKEHAEVIGDMEAENAEIKKIIEMCETCEKVIHAYPQCKDGCNKLPQPEIRGNKAEE